MASLRPPLGEVGEVGPAGAVADVDGCYRRMEEAQYVCSAYSRGL